MVTFPRPYKWIIGRFISHPVVWLLVSPIVEAGKLLQRAQMRGITDRRLDANPRLKTILQQTTVQHGPFQGMIYPSLKSHGSAFYPKILGCYERELHPVIEDICKTDYSEIVDIGCAEGYYAIGLGRRIPTAKVFAYDIDSRARAACHAMAKANHVEQRVVIRSRCTPHALQNFPFTRKGLIISDCEGFEKELFAASDADHFANCDLLIEMHDFIDMTISTFLMDRFRATHHAVIIKSIDDIEKAKTYSYPETDGFDLEIKKFVFQEYRQTIMEWLWLKPIQRDSISLT
jgi:SAM-dependent methyltransferase